HRVSRRHERFSAGRHERDAVLVRLDFLGYADLHISIFELLSFKSTCHPERRRGAPESRDPPLSGALSMAPPSGPGSLDSLRSLGMTCSTPRSASETN